MFATVVIRVATANATVESIMFAHLTSTLRRDDGQDIIEYGLLGAFISIVAVVTLQALGPLINDLYIAVQSALTP